jgi:hypothetical protein
MNGLQTANAPSSKIIVPHFIAGGVSFLVVALLLVFSNNELLTAYFDNKLIAITHITILGWASMMVFGALYQLIPVVYETSLYSEKLARITFWLFLISVLSLSYSFWIGSYTNLLFYASLMLFFSLLLFVVNLHLTYRKTQKPNIQSKFINTGIYWLAATELLGTLIALNFKYNFLSEIHLHYLKIHAHLGLIGWFLLLIIGAASILIPMFMISHNLNKKKLDYSYYFINAGLLIAMTNWFLLQQDFVTVIAWAGIAIGIGFFLSFVYETYSTRLRRQLDVGLKYTMIAIVLLTVPVVIALILLIFGQSTAFIVRVITVYGTVMIFGVISMLIFGQTYKTLPFIIWLDRYKNYVGKYKTPLPRQLYSEKLASFQFYAYLVSLSIIIIGIILKQLLVLQVGTSILIIVSLLNFANMLKMVMHKRKLEDL